MVKTSQILTINKIRFEKKLGQLSEEKNVTLASSKGISLTQFVEKAISNSFKQEENEV